jgi:two-component system phosphate regulon sensor histidine kinase PhoR
MKRLWSNSLVAKFFFTYLAIVLLLFAGFYLYSSHIIRHLYVSSVSRAMQDEARLLGRILPFQSQGVDLDNLCRTLAQETHARITVIAPDGRVLGDSAESSAIMENHRTRPEVLEAFGQGSGSSVRHSTTVDRELLYHAYLQVHGDRKRVIRVAVPLDAIDTVISALRRSLLLGLLVVSSIGLLLAYGFSRRLGSRVTRLAEFSRQLANGIYPQAFFSAQGQDEINILEQHLNQMAARIRDNIGQLSAEKEKVDSILRCMIEGVLVLDPKGRVLIINDQAARMFHTPRDRDVHGASIVELSRHPEMRKIFQEALDFHFNGERYVREVELENGQWFRVNAVQLTSRNDGVLGLILVFHDISDIKHLETMRSDFVANVSHELRTPLTAIRGYVETLLHAPPARPEDSRQFLTIIDRHSERLSRLTEDLLTLSDLESGKVHLTRQSLDAGQLMQRVLEVFWDRAAKKNIKLRYQSSTDLPKLMGDTDRLQQLFINLVDNAIKYTPIGGDVMLTASPVARQDSAPPMVEISVADTGPGIPETDLPRLTERFYRVDKARSRDLGGTGLGLAIVKHIVQAHKGDLKIESVINKGTTVRVRLPAVPSNSRA